MSLITNVTMALAKKEFKHYFITPIGYVFLFVFLAGIGYLTFEVGKGSFFAARQADLKGFFDYLPWMYLFLVPAVSMRLWSEERKSGTIEFLLTLPISSLESIVAKFLAALAFLGMALFLTFPIVLILAYLGDPDWGHVICGYLGAFLLSAVLLGMGLFFSAMTKNQVISFILASVVSYILLNTSSPPVLDFFSSFSPRYILEILEGLSLTSHFESMQRGVVRLSDLFYFVLMVSGFICATWFVIEEKKAQ